MQKKQLEKNIIKSGNQEESKKWYCRIAPSLGGGFAGTPESAWRTSTYNQDFHINKNVCFFGLYGLPDFYALWRHKGRKCILWAGSDIKHFLNGYWLESKGAIRLNNKSLAEWISQHCENYVENEVEYKALEDVGIISKIIPSFLGDVKNFQPQKNLLKNTYYSSVSGNDFKLYGWDKINVVAKQTPNAKYYLYGNTVEWKAPKNVIVRGRVSQQEMDNETKTMTGAMRMIAFEGFSEIVCKSILWGQKPISVIDYPFLNAEHPRQSLLKALNKYPWR